MGIDFIFTWYQQKIGTYDKQKWETKIEQREQRIYGLNHIQTRSAKPNTDLIDLDLVRGSSFTKAKPKHGFIKVIKLATLRCIFYPFYGYWWIKQTSKYVFFICLIIYILQIINIGISIYAFSESYSSMDIIIPMAMLWILCLIHSQIVATNPNEMQKVRLKQRQFSKLNKVKKKLKFISQEQPRVRREKISNKTGNESLDSIIKSCMEDKNSCESSIKNVSENRIEAVNGFCSTDSESEAQPVFNTRRLSSKISKIKHIPVISISQDSNCETDEETLISSPETKQNQRSFGDLTSSATDWMGVTTNSDCSCTSDLETSDEENDNDKESERDTTAILRPILNPRCANRVSCRIWELNEMKKADLSMVEIGSVIIRNVDSMPESNDYFYIGIFISILLALLPIICKILNSSTDSLVELTNLVEHIYINVTKATRGVEDSILILHQSMLKEIILCTRKWILSSFDGSFWEFCIMAIASVQRCILASMIFFLLAVAERTFKQRLLYAKLFSHLTSSRRAKKSEIPHFRLNKVINIKTWLSVRSYLKKRGPQRSVDVIVSTAFVVNLLLLTFLCVEVLKETLLFSQYYLEALVWCIGLGILLLRFMTLGTKINQKFRNPCVLITEQLNLHLQMEQKPHKKNELTVANNVLKLAIDLLKELEHPFTISGLSANPLLYNCTKLVILSALSGVFSEMLGFKLKLHKIKLK